MVQSLAFLSSNRFGFRLTKYTDAVFRFRLRKFILLNSTGLILMATFFPLFLHSETMHLVVAYASGGASYRPIHRE